MKDETNEEYEQMSVGSGDAPDPNSFSKRKKFKSPIDKKKISFIILLALIILLGIYFIIKSSYVSSLSDTNHEIQNEIYSLSQKEEKLKMQANKLLSQKESLENENKKLIKIIDETKEENVKLENEINDMEKGIHDQQSIKQKFEEKTNMSKQKLMSLVFKIDNLREKIKECDNQIKEYEAKIGEIEKSNDNDSKYKEIKKDKKEQRKKDKNNSEDNLLEINPNLKSRINSKIIVDPKYLFMLDDWFKKELKYKLLYRASEDGYSPQSFHSKVDKYKNTLIIIKDVNNLIFGGFTRKTWEGDKVYKKDKRAIVFNLDKEKYYEINDEDKSIFCDSDNLAIFGEGDIYLGADSIKSNFPKTYGSSKDNKENELTMGYTKLTPLEVEVFQLS